MDADHCALELGVVIAGAHLGGKRQEIELFGRHSFGHGVEPAGQQDLVHQPVELGDVLLEANLALRVGGILHQLHGQSDARHRGAQLVRSVGQQSLVALHQLLDLTSGAVEARGQPRHFIAAFHCDACREVAGAERFDTTLQALQTPGDLPHDGKGADTDRQREHHQHDMEYESSVSVPDRHARGQPSAVGQSDVRDGSPVRMSHGRPAALGPGRGQGAADYGDS